MIKIKSDINRTLLKNFAAQSFPDICIITASSKYNLTLAYLIIDSQYFQSLPPSTTQIDLSHLPEKALVQVLRALYGDQLIVYSVVQLEDVYKVIQGLGIDQYKHAIVQEILHNKDLVENLQILEFCVKNNLIVNQIKKVHISNQLRALQSNKNFLQLNKVSLPTVIPLLLQFYQQNEAQSIPIINSIMQNYFNRNNIRALQFFEKHDDVDILLSIWEQSHHILHIERKPQNNKSNSYAYNMEQRQANKKMQYGRQRPKAEYQLQKLRQKDMRISQLEAQIEQQHKTMNKLQKQLTILLSQGNKFQANKRILTTPVLSIDDEDEISLIEQRRSDSFLLQKRQRQALPLKNIKSEQFTQSVQKTDIKTPGGYIKINHKPNFIDV